MASPLRLGACAAADGVAGRGQDARVVIPVEDSARRDLLLHLIVGGDFYEPLERYEPDHVLTDEVRHSLPPGWRMVRTGIWVNVFPPRPNLPYQGWKIHVSATPMNAPRILRAVHSVCTSHDTAYKVLCDVNMLMLVNSKLMHRGSSGKFITIYPEHADKCGVLLDRLYQLLQDEEGPYILSDRRYKDCKVLYYRYGTNAGLQRMALDGSWRPHFISPEGKEVPDDRQPRFVLPPWVSDPFQPPQAPPKSTPTLRDGRYTITRALSFSNSGGVYLARDGLTGETVVVKEARPYTQTDRNGRDAISLLQKEWRILRKLAGSGVVPEARGAFWEWEHFYLVQSYVQGQTLHAYAAANGIVTLVQPSDAELDRAIDAVRIIWRELLKAMRTFHKSGVIIGDVSPYNIMVNPSTLDVTFIDLEGAVEIGVDDAATVATPGFALSDRFVRRHVTFEDDYYGLACILLWLLIPITPLLSHKPAAYREFMQYLQMEFGIPDPMATVVGSLMQTSSEGRSLDILVSQLEEPLQRSSAQPMHIASTLDDIRAVLPGIAAYIRAVMTPHRRDRLFPCAANNPNPLNISYGALGVAIALKTLDGRLDTEVVRWIESHEISAHRYPPGLYLGLSGIAWALHALGYEERAAAVFAQAADHPLLFESSDVFLGLSGFGLTSLYFWTKTGNPIYMDHALRVGEYLLKARCENDRGCYWPGTLPDATPLGYALGPSGIALFLLYLYCATDESRFLETGRKALMFDISYLNPVKPGLPTSTKNLTVVSPYWYAGSAGLATALLRYVAVTQDESLTGVLEQIVPDISRRWAISPGLFRGLAGMGNALLDYHDILGDPRGFSGAHRLADAILLYRVDKEAGTAFPGEFLHRLSTDFGTGSAGIGLFLHRLATGGHNFNFLPDELLRFKGRVAREVPAYGGAVRQ